jgi:hypothetical protein
MTMSLITRFTEYLKAGAGEAQAPALAQALRADDYPIGCGVGSAAAMHSGPS